MSEYKVKMNNYLYLRITMEHQRVNIDSSLTSILNLIKRDIQSKVYKEHNRELNQEAICLMAVKNDDIKNDVPRLSFKTKLPYLSDEEQPIIQLIKFTTGCGIDIYQWIQTFEQVQQDCGWSDLKSCAILKTCLVEEQLKTLVKACEKFSAVKSILLTHFYPFSDYSKYKGMLLKLKSKHFDKIEEYYAKHTELIDMYNLCINTNNQMTPVMKYRLFLSGLSNIEMNDVIHAKAKNADDAIKHLVEMRNLKETFSTFKLTNDKPSNKSLPTTQPIKQVNEKYYCDYCKTLGHIERFCRTKRKAIKKKAKESATTSANSLLILQDKRLNVVKLSYKCKLDKSDMYTEAIIDSGST
ncbi:hypothetical protein HERIO_1631 [Hepatospora eriocheir]|uniref:Uncharacterized protein n=1 Tax=Hepatospora eriocheir TaxID=1081669 RepID=A0A1X0Q9H3_9MICR|nr:hypothetical protein HERIO_1631 [Hepatospora eriocheir]